MAECIHCGSETELFNSGVPVCLKCVDGQDASSKDQKSQPQFRTILTEQLAEASARAKEAEEAFKSLIAEIPSGIPYPDGGIRIQNASREVSVRRAQVTKARGQLNDYLSHGLVPDDLRKNR
jgi:hypothetical protein